MTASIDIVKPENISETELQLSTKLEAILKRPPKRHSARAEVAIGRALEAANLESSNPERLSDKGLLQQSKPPFRQPATPAQDMPEQLYNEATVGGENRKTDNQHEPGDPIASVTPPRDLHLSTLVKTTRRARYRDGVRQVGSWVITLAVTAFITGCVAIMLLGLPNQLDPTAWISAHVTSQDAPTPVSATKVQTLEIKPARQ